MRSDHAAAEQPARDSRASRLQKAVGRFLKKKPLVPLMLVEGYEADGWLGLVTEQQRPPHHLRVGGERRACHCGGIPARR
eukprot:COSAG06_NODE_48113_length_333_cov_1.089362_1_plen_79_part_01